MNYIKYIITSSVFLCLIFISCKKVNNTDKRVNEITKVVSKPKKEAHENKGLLICKKNRVTYGKVKEGIIIKNKFLFKNEGTEPVEIVKYDASCNCTVLDIKGKIIQPNELLEIEMKSKHRHSKGPRARMHI